MRKQVYVYLHPSDMEAENPKNYHVIEALYDDETNTFTFSRDRLALDGQYQMDSNAEIVLSQKHPHADAHMRTFLADEQNDGKEVCANCVRYFYSDPRNA